MTAPMGLPPSDINVLVLYSREKNREFAKDFCDLLETMKWFVSDWFTFLMRPFWGKEAYEMFKGFIKQLLYKYADSMENGNNFVNYDAPLSMYFYGSPYSDTADPVIAATAAMYAGESLGLGTCMIGGVHPFIQSGKRAKLFREKYGIKYKSKTGLIVIFGYPAVKYRKGITRSFASVMTLN
jgi:nitroreductase